jgi:hypothetical protein
MGIASAEFFSNLFMVALGMTTVGITGGLDIEPAQKEGRTNSMVIHVTPTTIL